MQCERCGIEFKPVKRTRRFCSKRCSNSVRPERPVGNSWSGLYRKLQSLYPVAEACVTCGSPGSTDIIRTTPTCCESCGSVLLATAEPTSLENMEGVGGVSGQGQGTRFLYTAKASARERHPIADRNKHPTVKPLALMRWLVRLVTPQGGIVLDPFLGSGTTALACKAEGFQFIGLELDEHYVQIAEKRLFWSGARMTRKKRA